MKRPVHIEADKGACNRNRGGIVDERLRHERRDLLVDRLDTGGDFIGDFIFASPLIFEPVGFLAERFEPRLIFFTRRAFLALEWAVAISVPVRKIGRGLRSEEHTSELQSLMRLSYDVFCLKKKKHK